MDIQEVSAETQRIHDALGEAFQSEGEVFSTERYMGMVNGIFNFLADVSGGLEDWDRGTRDEFMVEVVHAFVRAHMKRSDRFKGIGKTIVEE